MLDKEKISRIAAEVAKANLTSSVFDATSDATVDSEGRDALRITIILAPGSSTSLQARGKAVLDTLVQIRERLQSEGEERFPIVVYATQEELDEIADQP